MTRTFSTTPDDTTYKITYAIMALCLVVAISSVYTYKTSGGVAVVPAVSAALLCGVIAAMYLLKPTSLDVDETRITIARKLAPRQIPFVDIKLVKQVPREDMRYAIRALGNGGLYGYTGYFYNKTMGFMTWYCTRRNNYVLIETTKGRKLIVTPDEPEAFVAYVKELYPTKANA